MKSFRYIKDLIAAHKYRYLAGIAALLGVDVLQLILPKILGDLTNLLESRGLTNNILARYSVLIVLLAVGIALFRLIFRYLIFGVSRSIEEALRNRLYSHLQRLSANYYNKHKTGDLMAHSTNDMNNITVASGLGVVIAVDCLLIPVVSLVMMLNTAGPGLTAASFSPLLLLGLSVGFFLKIMQARVQRQQEAFSELTETARENFSGIRVVKAFAQEINEIKRFERANSVNRQANMRFVRLMSMMFPTIAFISSLSFVIALWYGGALVIDRSLSLGSFVAFNGYLGMLIWPIAALGWVANIFQRGSVSLERVNAILDEVPEIQDDNASEIRSIEGTIELKELTFQYPGSAVPSLKNISLKVERGKTLAVVGRTGSGKTTLINLIPRLLNVPDGALFIDGTDINRIPLAVLRGGIGFVPQDTFLFSASIRGNIDFFKGSDAESVENASKTARIYDNIMDFPDRFETVVGERGVTLSGGQKQRIAIARAILLSPAILVLDDCLSAVDTHTEEEILKGLKDIMKNRTCIIVSHRISTIKEADEIIVLDEGEIKERGTHADLLAREGAYYELYMKQRLAEQIEEA